MADEITVHRIQLAKNREIPPDTVVQIAHPGTPGFIRAHIKLPWQKLFTDLGLLPIENGVVTLPLSQVFLCHAKEDESIVEELGDRLLQDGFLTWFDKKDLLPGDPWKTKIEEAIEGADYVLVFLSTSSSSKEGFFQNEVKIAMEQRKSKPSMQRYIIPVLAEPCEVPREFRDMHWLQLWKDGAYEKLKNALKTTI